MGVDYDPLSPRFRADPYPIYRRLRDQAPLHRSVDSGLWSLSRHEDVLAALNDPGLFSSSAMFEMLLAPGGRRLTWPALRFLVRFFLRTRRNPLRFRTARKLIAEDGDRHAQMRSIVNRGFTPRRIAALEPRVEQVVAECLAGARRGGAFDAIADLAVPLPVTIIAELLGVEPERRADFKRWSAQTIERATGAGRAHPFDEASIDTIVSLHRYISGIARQRRRSPADDVVSAIVAQRGEGPEGGPGLNDMEVVFFVILLLVAGNETTTNLIGNAADALLDHPGELARLRADPKLAPAAVEETLRYDPPVQVVFRRTTRPAEVAGALIPEGAIVALLLGSANRDERRFPDPDRFDLSRNTQGHLGFGFGAHFCLGAALARLEAVAAVEGLAPLLAERRRGEPRELVDSFLVRGPTRLPLVPGPRA